MAESFGSDEDSDEQQLSCLCLPENSSSGKTREHSRSKIEASCVESVASQSDCHTSCSKHQTSPRKKSDRSKDSNKSRNQFWTVRLKRKISGRLRKGKEHGIPTPLATVECTSCVCTGYRRTDDHILGPGVVFNGSPASIRHYPSLSQNPDHIQGAVGEIETRQGRHLLQIVPVPGNQAQGSVNRVHPAVEDVDDVLRRQRAQDMEQGIDMAGASPSGRGKSLNRRDQRGGSFSSVADSITSLSSSFQTHCGIASVYPSPPISDSGEVFYGNSSLSSFTGSIPRAVHSQVDYIHCLVPDLTGIMNCTFYWGIMDRYEAEKLLDNRPEGTFLLRDSAQEEFLFSVSFRRYGRSLHARIEQWNHNFSFDSHDPGVYASESVCGLIKHYKDPSCCMFFEPMLTLPLNRTFPFNLQNLCRGVICSNTVYDGISLLPLPKSLKDYLRYYHYKQKVRMRRFEPQV